MNKLIRFCHLIDPATENPLLFNSVKFSDRSRFDYVVISLAPEGDLQEQMRSISVKSLSINCSARRGYPTALMKLVRYFRSERFDVVQVHGFEASFVGLIAAIIARIPVRIFSGHHSHEVPLYGNARLMAVDSFLARHLATQVIAPSRNMRDIFVNKHRVPAAKIEVIEHGMYLDDWRRQAQQASNIRREFGFEKKMLFGSVGRLFWVKGFDTLIRAFSVVARARDDIALAIAGDGGDRPQLEGLISELGMGERIKLIGKRTDIAAVMNEFDVLIHPSIAESFGLIYPEALALGKPVIATRGGIAEDIVRNGENGYLINPGSLSEMTDAIEKMIGARASWAAMGENARTVSERFSVTKTQRVCDKFIASLVKYQ
ncbi:glycosyltransferase [Leptolyngbya sp. 7M]|uniref:glycosyltransferase n=1 Tax=Leptolyngbya sp. 7M TaxID=2812896 RepID=UPI001B8C319A|nr:glycosyltransferase [Leptolyngbya sp. 7M]QYO66336.1 glycosyltransferase [Leptolyngbya sp. 7M]